MPTSESSTRISTGIEPIDSALGGLEAGRPHVIYGDAETGKTTLAMRFLVEGLRHSEKCAAIVRYQPSRLVAALSDLGYDARSDISSGRLVVLGYAGDLVDRLAETDDISVILDELAWQLGPGVPSRIVLDTADFIFAIQQGYGYSVRAPALLAWLEDRAATSLLVVEERTNERIVQSFRANAASVLRAMVRPYGDRLEYHLAFEKVPTKVPQRRIGFAHGEFETLEIIEANASTMPLRVSPRRHQAAGDRTGQLTMPAEAARLVAEAAASPEPPTPSRPQTPRSASEPQRPSARSGRPRVLLIDEEKVTGQLVGRALEPEFDVAVETDGIAGLARIAALDPDLVILEASLQLVDGFTIARQIREASSVPIVMIAGTHVTNEDRVRSASAGADHYLVKPFGLSELLIRARQLVARFRGRPVPASAGETPYDPLVSYDQFVESLLVGSGSGPRALLGYRMETNGAVNTGRVLDIVRSELRHDDLVTVEPEDHQLIALIGPDNPEEFAGLLQQRIHESTGEKVSFWISQVVKGGAMRTLAERTGRTEPGGESSRGAQRAFMEFMR